MVNSGAVMSRGASRNLGAVALPSAKAGAGGVGTAGEKPDSLVGVRSGGNEYKVKWADVPQPTWMTRAGLGSKFGKKKLGELEKGFTKHAGKTHADKWLGAPIPPKEAARRWPDRKRPAATEDVATGWYVCQRHEACNAEPGLATSQHFSVGTGTGLIQRSRSSTN